MSSEIDIVNLALSRLGDSATVASLDPPEGSALAEHAARFYPIARDTLLEAHNWLFATKRKALALTTEASWEWAYAYAAPADAIKILAVYPLESYTKDDEQAFDTESGDQTNLILTDQENAVVRYIATITDTTRFPPLVIDALAWLLASYLAGPILKGDAGAAAAGSCYKAFMASLGQAKVSDANQRNVKPDHTPAWIEGR